MGNEVIGMMEKIEAMKKEHDRYGLSFDMFDRLEFMLKMAKEHNTTVVETENTIDIAPFFGKTHAKYHIAKSKLPVVDFDNNKQHITVTINRLFQD